MSILITAFSLQFQLPACIYILIYHDTKHELIVQSSLGVTKVLHTVKMLLKYLVLKG